MWFTGNELKYRNETAAIKVPTLGFFTEFSGCTVLGYALHSHLAVINSSLEHGSLVVCQVITIPPISPAHLAPCYEQH